MTDEVDYWKEFWENKNEPFHSYNTEEYYDKYSRELLMLLGNKNYKKVLELGCGSGEFYERLNFSEVEKYRGTDLSSSMLNEFKRKYPEVDLHTASGHEYVDDQKYDLIYSNGVMQNFNEEMLRNHFMLAEKMLNEDGYIVDASLPWNIHRYNYRTGRLTPPYSFSLKKYISWALSTLRIKKDSLGHWHSPNKISEIAKEFGLVGEYCGSLYYPYRFHSVLRKIKN